MDNTTTTTKFFHTWKPPVFTVELVLPRHARCVFSRVRCNGHNLLLNSHLFRIENPSESACDHPIRGTPHIILCCPATDSLRRSHFGDFFVFTTSGTEQGTCFHGLPPCPNIRKGGDNDDNNNKNKFLCFF